MAIFKRKTPVQKTEDQLATLKARRDRVDSKRAAAKIELDVAERARLALLTESDADDPQAEAKAQARVDSARSALDGLLAALSALNGQIAAAEQKLTAERDQAERNVVAEKIEANVVAAEKTLDAIDMLRIFGEAFTALSPLSYDARQIDEAVREIAKQFEAAASAAISDVRSQAARIRNGTAKIPDLRPEPLPSPPPAPERTERVFALKPLRWTGSDGQVHVAPSRHDVQLPVEAARRALDLKAALEPNDERVKQLRGTLPFLRPLARTCVNLDAGAEEVQPEEKGSGIVSAAALFEPLDRGAPYTATIPRTVAQ
jgi:hypothetical protein